MTSFASGPGMAVHVASFSAALRAAGLPTHPAAALDACRAVGLVDLADPEQFYWALRANFVTDPGEAPAFDAVFQAFWREAGRAEPQAPQAPGPELPSVVAAGAGPGEAVPARRAAAGGAGDRELLLAKDLRSLAPEEEPRLAAILRELLAKLATRPGRRERPGARGRRLELRGTLRRSARRAGEILRLVRKERRPRRRRLVFVGDVSGSMDAYNRFFLLLAFALGRREPGTEVYAFSTRLFRLTGHLRAGRDAPEDTRGWSGGTAIGACLRELNGELRAKTRLRRTVVVVLSDGWDRGDPELLRRELARLRGAVAKLYWLNPLKGHPDYEPLCRGMAAALPYLDGFYAAHNVESLARFARELVRAR